MVEITECPVCKNQSLKDFLECKDYTVSHETFSVKQCQACLLGITTPRPDVEKLGSYYQSDQYISHSGKTSGGIGMIYRIARNFALSWKAGIVDTKKANPSILDFGCGTGEFLKTVKDKGWQVEGFEPSDDAREKAEITVGQKINTSFQEISQKQFDVITAWHVIEHVPDLAETISKLKDLLKKDGTIFIAVPNYESPDAKKYKQHWAGFDVPRHLWHFSRKSMTQLLETYQLQLVQIVPMKLDAYYVSMLSEKYKTGKDSPFNLMKGFLSGLTSNLSSRKNTNHSSLIYIARHR